MTEIALYMAPVLRVFQIALREPDVNFANLVKIANFQKTLVF